MMIGTLWRYFPPKTILIVMLMESEYAPKIKSFKEKSQNVKCQCISNFETRNICLHSFLSVFVVADETESILGLHVTTCTMNKHR